GRFSARNATLGSTAAARPDGLRGRADGRLKSQARCERQFRATGIRPFTRAIQPLETSAEFVVGENRELRSEISLEEAERLGRGKRYRPLEVLDFARVAPDEARFQHVGPKERCGGEPLAVQRECLRKVVVHPPDVNPCMRVQSN